MKYIIQLVVLSVFSLLFLSCGKEKKEVQQSLRPVKYQQIGYLGGDKIRTFSGTAKTDKIINLSFRSSGIITEFNMKLGQKVRKGQLLAKLDNVQSRLSFEQARTQVNSAQSQMNTAKLGLNRVRSLYEKGSASLSDFENSKNSYKTAQEAFNSAKRGLDIQAEQIKFGFIYAPDSGVIASVSAEIDENVSPGQTIATLNAGTEMEITLGLPESVINGVKENMKVDVTFTALADKKFVGKVTEVAPAVSANTATYPVKIAVTNPSDLIKSGMASNVTFDFGNHTLDNKVLVAPANAVGEDSNGNFVFVVNGEGEKGTVKKQKVTIGKLTSEGFEITSGLNAGQKIATAGLQTLLDGQEVKLN
ncbi:efflux RND transporter periplasmic adaptor subunit [uncultured Tenacibaculum sp.]|uniref:efflux RND transporter periplasmic adaptor subunit n=1 Tax=uncultured Tenacibaculum sp. TaxID=174713 RepID=UPI002616BAA8|nr:efflux RND transporter periplasmic adaptor subunit [uncultured Tenacibaculum sp.]